jgi:hypothetical protein
MSMALVFADPGNPANRGRHSAEDGRTELVAMRCVVCKDTKAMLEFPKSAATYRRGSCTVCNTQRSRTLSKNPLERKLTSARVRYGSRGGLRASDVAQLYEREGVDWTDPLNLYRTCLVKGDTNQPFGPENVAIRWRYPAKDYPLGCVGGSVVVRCN